jgi:hypothetical protein
MRLKENKNKNSTLLFYSFTHPASSPQCIHPPYTKITLMLLKRDGIMTPER